MPFRTETTASVMTPASFEDAAVNSQMGVGEAFWESIKGGALSSMGLGTAIRETAIPPGAPTAPEDRVLTPQKEITLGDTGVIGDGPSLDKFSLNGNPAIAPPRVAPPVRAETQPEFEARRAAAQPLSKEEYEGSSFYRKGIPWDPRMNPARAEALASWYDAKQVRENRLEKTNTTAVQTIGGLLGQAADPLNYVPMLGPAARAMAVSRMGWLAGRAVTASADAVLNTAVAEFATRDLRESYGDDVSFGAMMLDIGSAAVIGAVFGGVEGIFGKRAFDRRQLAIRHANDIQAQLNDAVGSLLTTGEVRLNQASLDAAERIRVATLEEARRQVDLNLRSSTAMTRFLPEQDAGGIPLSFDEHLRAQAETAARTERPDVFGRLDKTTEAIDRIDAEIRLTRERANGGSDVEAVRRQIDPETADRLGQIDEELLKEGIPRKRRQDLEREREMIASTIDEQLPSVTQQNAAVNPEAARVQTEKLARLEQKRAEMVAHREQHAGRAMREIDRQLTRQEAAVKKSLFIPPEPRPDPALKEASSKVDRRLTPDPPEVATKPDAPTPAERIRQEAGPTTIDRASLVTKGADGVEKVDVKAATAQVAEQARAALAKGDKVELVSRGKSRPIVALSEDGKLLDLNGRAIDPGTVVGTADKLVITPDRAPAPVSKTARELAHDFGVDPATGDFVEMAELQRLIKNGRMLPEEAALFNDATAMLERSKSYGDGLRAAAICMMG